MTILVLGSGGQLGRSLFNHSGLNRDNIIFSSRADIDIANLEVTRKKIKKLRPDIIINASAYTAVDKAEDDQDNAYMINYLAIKNIASLCKEIGSGLIHISTDYVFDGTSKVPYLEKSKTNPQSVYGKSKLQGELAIQSSGCKYLIFRTSWVFSEYGSNFLKTMLRLGLSMDELSIVEDQIGCPTYAPHLAGAIVSSLDYLKKNQLKEIYNYAGNSSCSWAQFADSIFKEALRVGILKKVPNILRVRSDKYITRAARPKNSQLNSLKFECKFKYNASDWTEGLKLSLLALQHANFEDKNKGIS